jgi:hypothetical protein
MKVPHFDLRCIPNVQRSRFQQLCKNCILSVGRLCFADEIVPGERSQMTFNHAPCKGALSIQLPI